MQALELEMAGLIHQRGNDDPERFVTAYLSDLERLVLSEQLQSGDDSFRIQGVTPARSEPQTEGETDAMDNAPRRVFQMSFQGRYATLCHEGPCVPPSFVDWSRI